MVTTVKYLEGRTHVKAVIDGQIYVVPVAADNRHWQQILVWLEDDTNMIAEPDPVQITDSETPIEKLQKEFDKLKADVEKIKTEKPK